MSSIRLRTLTEKSTIGFGKYKDLRIFELIALRPIKGKQLLCWYYYNASKINYSKDLLNTLGISKEIQIEKPATDKGNVEFLKIAMENRIKLNPETALKEVRCLEHKKILSKIDKGIVLGKQSRLNKINYSSNRLMMSNHGH